MPCASTAKTRASSSVLSVAYANKVKPTELNPTDIHHLLVSLMKSRVLTTVLATVLAVAAGDASATERVALVIGNTNYGDHKLPHAKEDAKLVAKSLEKLKFRCAVEENLDKEELEEAIHKFAERSPSRSVAVIYFAGFGGQDRGKNFIQGAGKPRDKAEDSGLRISEIRRYVTDHSGARHTLMIFDAAFHNPMVHDERNRNEGFSAIREGEEDARHIVLLGHAPGSTIEAPEGKHGALAEALAKHLPKAEASLSNALDEISAEVKQQTDDKQSPHVVYRIDEANEKAWQERLKFPIAEGNEVREGNTAGEHWVNPAGMVFCWIPPGKYMMGRDAERDDTADAEPVEVEITQGFWMAKYEFTQRHLNIVRGRRPHPDTPFQHDNAPLVYTTFGNAEGIGKRLTDQQRNAGLLPSDWEYALPSEAQWEYACRAGADSRFHCGDSEEELAEYANFADRSLLEEDDTFYWASRSARDDVGKRFGLVGRYEPNAWGLCDMHGNVAEWCRDHYQRSLVGGKDPEQSNKGEYMVIRGGSWCSAAENCEAGYRNFISLKNGYDFVGLRLVLQKESK